MNGKNFLTLGILAALAAFFFFRWKKGGINNSGYSISTPWGGGAVNEDPLTNTVNISATISKKKSKKKGLFVGKLKNALKKVIPGAVSLATSYIPVVGPIISKGVDAATKGKKSGIFA